MLTKNQLFEILLDWNYWNSEFPETIQRKIYENKIERLSQTDEGNLLISTVYGASLFSPTGEVLVEYDIPKDRGWAPVRVSGDNTAFYIANFS